MNAFKRITVEFTHEVDGKRKSEKIDLLQRCNTGIGTVVDVVSRLTLPKFSESWEW